MKTVLAIFLTTCTVIAFISESANYQKQYYIIDKVKGNKYIEICPENSIEIEYQTIERNK